MIRFRLSKSSRCVGLATLNEGSSPYFVYLDFGTFNLCFLADRRLLPFLKGLRVLRGSRAHRREVS